METHIGSLVEKELRKQRRSVTWLARELCCARTNVYTIFLRKNIDAELLMRLSEILNHDFFAELSAEVSLNSVDCHKSEDTVSQDE